MLTTENKFDSNDIITQLKQLSILKNGWYNGIGLAPRKNIIKWFENSFVHLYSKDLRKPKLFPTLKGNIQAEWSTLSHEISLEILKDKGVYQSLNINTTDFDIFIFEINNKDDWKIINQKLSKLI